MSLRKRRFKFKNAFELLTEAGNLGCKPANILMEPHLKFSLSNGELLTDSSSYRRPIAQRTFQL